ncbi:MAG TPA: hypothetical protein VKT83_05520 [bacterium]|nr:hypothetical protein [bacterium]
MSDQSGYEHGGKWPRRLVHEDMHYIVHKVAEATVRDGAVVLSCVHEDGRPYYGGPYHPSVFKSHRRPINEHLSEWGIVLERTRRSRRAGRITKSRSQNTTTIAVNPAD